MSDWWDFINKYKYALCLLLILLALAFIVMGHAYRDQVQLVLKQELCKFPECSLDWWSVSHFTLFAIFGFLIPEYPLTFFTMGAGFEFIEDCLSSEKTTILADCTCKDNMNNILCRHSINDGYWYCNPSDIFVNLTGYIVGSAIRTVLFSDTLNYTKVSK